MFFPCFHGMRYLASEASATLTVTQPNIVIVDWSAPSEAKQGETVRVSWTIRNDGDLPTPAGARLIDRDTKETVAPWGTVTLDPGATMPGRFDVKMPGKDWNLRLQAVAVVGQLLYVTDYVDFTIGLLIGTKITGFAATPSTVMPGQTVTVGGKLLDEANNPLAGMTVTIDLSSLGLGTVDLTTGSDGSFSHQFTCPEVASGNYTIYARFAGATVAGVVYAPSTAKAGLGVMAVEVPTALWGAMALVGAGLLGYAVWKRF